MKSTKKKIESALFWTIGFLVLVFVFLIVFTFDFRGGSDAHEEKGKIVAAAQEVRDYYHGISPYWLERYQIDIATEEDIHADIDGDGLSLLQEYRYLTNPFVADTDGDGYSDGAEVANGYSPTGAGRLDVNGNDIPDHWEEQYGLSGAEADRGADPDGDGLINELEYAHDTDPKTADTDGDGFDDFREIQNGYDPDAPGNTKPVVEIIIPKINVAAPVVLSDDPAEEALQEDLKRGVIHYPDTATPGQVGNSMISGHSSNYAWVNGGYNYIFKDLNELEAGDEFTLKTLQDNGKTQSYTYRVTDKFVAAPDDIRIFQDTENPTATLVTCWPLNSNWKRLIVKADIVETQKVAQGF